ncbi:MAG: hypothetical protein QOG77_3332, partial [Solirubrobacteraceae bacterium]|nr:hypothetical protein [Solirubrobacteraceae bacterium]
MKLLHPLRERDFALLWTGMTVSLLGDGIFLVALAWQVYDLDNDPVALSLVGTAWTLGMVAFLLTGGVVSDRVERRRVLVAADVVRALALVAMGVLSLTGVVEIWHLVALSVLMGIALGAPRAARGLRLRPPRAVALVDHPLGRRRAALHHGPAAGAAALHRAQRARRGSRWLRPRARRCGRRLGRRLARPRPVSKAIGIDATLVIAAIVPAVACVVLYVVAGL